MISDILYRLRALFRRDALEDEMNDEQEFHIAQQAEKWKRNGLSEEEAMRQARMDLSGKESVKERCRESRGVGWLEILMQDAIYALRLFRRSPGFTSAVTLSLALGIGANTAIFSMIDAVIWRMLPIENPEQLLLLTHGQDGKFESGFTYQQYRAMQEQNRQSARLAAWAPARINVGVNGSIEPPLLGHLVSGGYFALLGVRPAAGRVIGPEDDRRPNGHLVAMLSNAYWIRRFAGDRSIIGRSITVSGAPFTIIGVTPPEFFGVEVGVHPDVFVPLMMQPAVMPAFENLTDQPQQYLTWVHVLARPEQGTPLAQVSSELGAAFQQQVPRGGKFKVLANETLRLTTAATGISDLRREFSQPLFILILLVAVVLIIACANTANLLLARAAARQSEFAMRVSLGAGRGRLISQLLVESTILSLFGGLLGLLIANWCTSLLLLYLSSGRAPIQLAIHLDLRVLGFTAAVSIATGLLFGLIPAIRTGGLATEASSRYSTARLRPGKVLAVLQVALSLALLIGAGVFARSLQNLIVQGEMASADKVYVVRVEPKGSDQRNAEGALLRLDRTYRDLIQRIEAIRGVDSATMAQFTPTTPRGASALVATTSGDERRAFVPMIYPRYFSTLGIPLLAGRDVDQRDLTNNAPLVTVVNETLARHAFPGHNGPGQQLRLNNQLLEVIGVVADSRLTDPRREAVPTAYVPFLQLNTGRGQMALYVRSSLGAGEMVPRIREVVQDVDRTMPLFELRTLGDELAAVLLRERMMASLSGLFSIVALALASIGLYGLFSFAVVHRTREIGIRMALGAERSNVLGAVMREVLTLLAYGIAAGVPLAIVAIRLVAGQVPELFGGINAGDPAVVAGATLLLLTVASIAGFLPARRASLVDPIRALRNE
jgi:predicted permease